MRRATLLIAVLVLTPLTTAAGQGAIAAPGARIRVSAQGLATTQVVGTVVALHADTLVLAPQSGRGLLALPLESVQRLDVSRGRKSLAGAGAGIGGVIGAVSGAVWGAASCAEPSFVAPEQCAIMGGLLVGAGGALLGAVVGALSKTERWQEVPLDQLRVSVVPQRDGGFALQASLRF